MTYPPPGIRFVGCGTANRPSGGPGKAPERPRAVHSTPWVVCGRFGNAARIVDRPIRPRNRTKRPLGVQWLDAQARVADCASEPTAPQEARTMAALENAPPRPEDGRPRGGESDPRQGGDATSRAADAARLEDGRARGGD